MAVLASIVVCQILINPMATVLLVCLALCLASTAADLTGLPFSHLAERVRCGV